MIALFKWMERLLPADCGDLGTGSVVTRVVAGRSVPVGCVGLVADAAGSARRVLAGQRLEAASHELVWCFHPGPYRMEIAPFAHAPEMGLHLQVVVDDADPRLRQQRFDLFVMAEVRDGLCLTDLKSRLEMQLAAALEQGMLELPPCTTLDEWHAFRAGLNQLVYTRFGLTVEDCFPVDLGDRVDYAALLAARPALEQAIAVCEPHGASNENDATALPTGVSASASSPTTHPAPTNAADERALGATDATRAGGAESAKRDAARAVAAEPGERNAARAGGAEAVERVAPGAGATQAVEQETACAGGPLVAAVRTRFGARPVDAVEVDALALRRMFLELPHVMCSFRAAALPDCPDAFRVQKSLLARLDIVLLSVSTMPTLELEAPGVTLPRDEQHRRATASAQAIDALDDAWSLLARIELAGRIDEPMADSADRIIANLEAAVANRRATRQPGEQGEDA